MTTTKAKTNGAAPAVEPALTPEFVARTIDLSAVKPTFGEMVDMEDALGVTPGDLFVVNRAGQQVATTRGMLGLAWLAIRRLIPDVTIDDVRALSPEDFGSSLQEGKGAGHRPS